MNERLYAEIMLSDVGATKAFAGRLAPYLKIGDVIAFDGALGAGKTEFCRALIHAFGYHDDVPSPTFNLVQIYSPPLNDQITPTVWHMDLYRLEEPEDVFELGIEEAFDTAVTLLEWPSKMGTYLPAGFLTLRLEIESDGKSRKLTALGDFSWKKRLKEIFQ